MTEGIPADENTAEVSVTFDLLANARRRGVLYAVKRDGAATVEELAERIAAWQGGADEQRTETNALRADGDGASSPSPADVRTSLLHVHLPKLADAKVVEYDADDGTVELAEADDLDPYLRAAGESESLPSHLDRRTELAD